MVEITLSKGQVALVDDEDAPRIRAFKWCAGWNESSRTYYAYRGISPAKSPTGKFRLVLMHRFILGIEHGDPRKVDHRDHNGLNNQKENIRACTHSRNMQNANSTYRPQKSKFKGVTSPHNRWLAQIKVQGKLVRLGTFTTEEEAALAYDRAAIIHFGEFALTNATLFPELLKAGVA